MYGTRPQSHGALLPSVAACSDSSPSDLSMTAGWSQAEAQPGQVTSHVTTASVMALNRFLHNEGKVREPKCCNETSFIHNIFYSSYVSINMSLLYFLCWVLQLYRKIIKKIMIHFEVRRRHRGGLSSAVIPLAPSRSTSFASLFSLGKKAFVPELRRGLGHV